MNEEDYLEDSNCLKGPYYSVLSVRVIVTSVHKQLIVEGEIEDDGGNVFFLGVADAKKAATFYQAERSVIDDIINMEKRYYTGAASWIEVPNVGIFDWYETNRILDEQIQSDVFDIHVALYKVFLSVKNAYEYDDHASSDHSEADPTSKDEESVYQVYQLSKMFKDDEDEKTYIAAVSGNKVTGFKLSLSSGGEVVERFETLQDAVYSRWFFLYADLAGQYDAWLNM